MKPQFSELSYSYALTENLVHALGIPLLSAPTFPSTVAEGKQGGGYDLKLSCPGMSIFLQFKLSHCMTNKSAKEFTSGKFTQLVGGVKKPVYRMYLHPLGQSRQTSLMLKLEKRHGLVFYVAPLFHLPKELNVHYAARNVASASRFIRPSVIKKMPDQLEHVVSFRDSGKPWRFSSDPVELEDVESQDKIVTLLKEAGNRQVATKQVIQEALDSMIQVLIEDGNEVSRNIKSHQQTIDRLIKQDMPLLAKAEYIARTYFDSQLLTFNIESSKDANSA